MAINGTSNGVNGHSKPVITASPESLKAARDVVRVNLVKQRMENNQVAHSLGLRICLSTEMPLLAARAGYSALLMNLEHSATGLESASAICTACMNVGITPMVVVPSGTAEWISRSLDSGAQAVIIPHVNNVAEAKICVNAGKFRPVGNRSMTMVTPMMQYSTGIDIRAVAQVSNENILIMPMIETVEGVENVEAIAATEGIDCLLIGCGDLCVELDIPGEYDNPLFHETVDKIAAACVKASVNGRKVFIGIGGLEPRPDILEKFMNKHPLIRYVMAGRDIVHLFEGMKKQAKQMEDMSSRLTSA